jgi:hypothetical protein
VIYGAHYPKEVIMSCAKIAQVERRPPTTQVYGLLFDPALCVELRCAVVYALCTIAHANDDEARAPSLSADLRPTVDPVFPHGLLQCIWCVDLLVRIGPWFIVGQRKGMAAVFVARCHHDGASW